MPAGAAGAVGVHAGAQAGAHAGTAVVPGGGGVHVGAAGGVQGVGVSGGGVHARLPIAKQEALAMALHPRLGVPPYTLAPYALHPQPSTLHPHCQALHPAPYTLSRASSISNLAPAPRGQLLNRAPDTLHPTPYTLQPKHETRNTKRETLNPEPASRQAPRCAASPTTSCTRSIPSIIYDCQSFDLNAFGPLSVRTTCRI